MSNTAKKIINYGFIGVGMMGITEGIRHDSFAIENTGFIIFLIGTMILVDKVYNQDK